MWKSLTALPPPPMLFPCFVCGNPWFEYIQATQAIHIEGEPYIVGGRDIQEYETLKDTNARYLKCLRCNSIYDRRGNLCAEHS